MSDAAVSQDVELVGHVSVDSGQVMIVDPCYVLDGEYDEAPEHDPADHKQCQYGHPCAVTLSDTRHGEVFAKGFGTAVAASSGYGDGNYPVYAVKNEDGRVVELTIYFDEAVHELHRTIRLSQDRSELVEALDVNDSYNEQEWT